MESKKILLVLLLPAVLLLSMVGCNESNPYSNGLELRKLSEIDNDLVEVYCSDSMDGYAVTGYTGGDKNIVVPAQYQGEPVVAIIDAFKGNADVASVSIPDSVILIENAFHSCTGLTEVTIPHSVVCIGNNTFSHCTNLTRVTIPDSVTEIGESAFRDCTGLADMTIPDSVTVIGTDAFCGCIGLAEVAIPGNVTEIGSGAFSYCNGLTEVTIPDSVTEIGPETFCGCIGLTGVTIPDSITKIGTEAFSGCTELTDVTIPDSVTEIGAEAFNGCCSLVNVTLGNSVTKIDFGAFTYCALTEIVIPDSLASYKSAFDDGVVLKSKMYYYLRTLPIDEVLAQAEQHLGEELTDEREFSLDQLSAFGDRMTGLFVSLDHYWRPDINSFEYSADMLSGRPQMVPLDLDGVPKEYLDAMLTAKKIAAIQNGDAEIVYALIECTGYTVTLYSGPSLYHEMYRISFRSLENDTLLGWYQWETGYAPESYSSADLVYYNIDINAHRVCLERDGSNPDPVLDIMKALYGD